MANEGKKFPPGLIPTLLTIKACLQGVKCPKTEWYQLLADEGTPQAAARDDESQTESISCQINNLLQDKAPNAGKHENIYPPLDQFRDNWELPKENCLVACPKEINNKMAPINTACPTSLPPFDNDIPQPCTSSYWFGAHKINPELTAPSAGAFQKRLEKLEDPFQADLLSGCSEATPSPFFIHFAIREIYMLRQ